MSTGRFDRLPAAIAFVLVVAGAAFVTPAVHTVQSDDYMLGSNDLEIAKQPLTEDLAALRTLAIQ